METVEILEIFKIADLDKIAAIIRFPEEVVPEIDNTFLTTDKKKIKITGIEMHITGSLEQIEKWETSKAEKKFGCTIKFIEG